MNWPFVFSISMTLCSFMLLRLGWRMRQDQLVTCPLCGEESYRVLYMGLPMRLCSDETCRCLYGVWSWVMSIVPFNGVFFRYNGGYLRALWEWFRSVEDEEE